MKSKYKIISIIISFILLFTPLVIPINIKANTYLKEPLSSDNFYFIQITDIHIMNTTYEERQLSIMRFKSVLKSISSFNKKPAFVVITGDLCEWGSALNYKAFIDCLYEKDEKLYIDPNYSIPVYTTPGNHDYILNSDLVNYYKYVNKDRRYTVEYRNLTLFFLDSGFNYMENVSDLFLVKGSGLNDDDIAWLEEELSKCSTKYKIILMHHPAINERDEKGEMRGVIAKNREKFIDLCKEYDVELVLSGHTHNSVVYDEEENRYENFPINCSMYSTLFVQTDAVKFDKKKPIRLIPYRNISIVNDTIFIEKTDSVNFISRYKIVNFPILNGLLLRYFNKN